MESLLSIFTGLITEGLAFLIGVFFTFLIIRIPFLRFLFKRIGVNFYYDRPQLDFDIVISKSDTGLDLIIKNAGTRPAYNVYAYIFEHYPQIDKDDNNYRIKSLGDQNIRSGVLAIGESVAFTNKKLEFIGCNVTCKQEIWVDYSDENGDHYRTIVETPSPRGDELQILPPIKIKKRLLMIPGYEYTGKIDWKKLRDGRINF